MKSTHGSNAQGLRVAGFTAALMLVAAFPLAAETSSSGARMPRDADVVILKNGDRLTGEVKRLERGRLKFKTDTMGTVYIEWDEVARLTAKETLEARLESGERHVGHLGANAGEGELEVVGGEGSVKLDQPSVVRIAPIGETFWERLDGSFDLGFSFTQANEATQLNLNTELEVRSRTRLASIDLSSVISSRDDAEETERHSLRYLYVRFLPNRRLVLGLGELQRNLELGLDLRTLVGGGYGGFLADTNRTTLAIYGGLAFSEENLVGSQANQGGVEALLALTYSFFTYDTPKTDVSVSLAAFPSLSESGRVRLELDSSLRREIVKDFYWSLSVFDSFDSEPLAEGAEENDWGAATSFGWTF